MHEKLYPSTGPAVVGQIQVPTTRLAGNREVIHLVQKLWPNAKVVNFLASLAFRL